MLMRLSLLSACFVVATASPSFAAGCLRLPYQFTVQAELPASGSTPAYPTVLVQMPGVPFEIEQVSVATSTSTVLDIFPTGSQRYTGIADIHLVTLLHGNAATHPLGAVSLSPTPGQDSGFTKRVTLYADASSTVTLKARTLGDNPVQISVTLVGRLVWPACWTTPQ